MSKPTQWYYDDQGNLDWKDPLDYKLEVLEWENMQRWGRKLYDCPGCGYEVREMGTMCVCKPDSGKES